MNVQSNESLKTRVEKLEFAVAEIREALMGDIKNPGGTLKIVQDMHLDLVQIKIILETLKLERAKVIGGISVAVAIGGIIGKFLLR